MSRLRLSVPPDERRVFETRFGSLTLRFERPDDEDFLAALFRSHSARPLEEAGLTEIAIDTIVALQFRSANATHRALFPNARYSIIEFEERPIGRLIEEDEGETVYFVDFAIVPELQAKGIGTAFIEQVANAWGRKGRAARVEVLYINKPSLKLCQNLGFVQIEDKRMGYVNLRRMPPAGA